MSMYWSWRLEDNHYGRVPSITKRSLVGHYKHMGLEVMIGEKNFKYMWMRKILKDH